MPSKPLLLLTDPTHFEVSYRINPWMRPYAWAENPVGHLAAARRSFQSLAAALTAAGARLEIMPGVAGLPDMVFPANAAIVLDRLALLSRFRHPRFIETDGNWPVQVSVLLDLDRHELVSRYIGHCSENPFVQCALTKLGGHVVSYRPDCLNHLSSLFLKIPCVS